MTSELVNSRPTHENTPVVAAVAVDDLHKSYGRTTAVDHVSLSIACGQVFGVVGPNGAGKTTLLETVVGLRVVSSGWVRVLGLDPHRQHRQLSRRIAVQPQTGALFPTLSARETVRLWASFYPSPADPEDVLELVGLTDKADDRVKRLSGGQQQRLLLAITLIGRPEVLFLDEPTGALDPAARQQLWAGIRSHRDNGGTVVLTTHSMQEAASLCDTVAIMDGGRIVASSSPEHLVREHFPASTVVFRTTCQPDQAALAALPGVDTVDVRWSGGGGGARVAMRTTAPEDTLREVLASPSAHGATDLRLEQGSLEDVFLALTGHALSQGDA